jgi:dihydroorotase
MSSGPGAAGHPLAAGCYNAVMTLVEITYELQSPLTEEQMRHLGQFANTYGLRSFRVDESKKQLSFEYDASRLRETQVAHVLGQARIAVTRRVN